MSNRHLLGEEIKVTKRNFSFNVIDNDIFKESNQWDFWSIYESWENETFDVLDQFLSKDLSFLDIGAWIGPVSIYAAELSRHVYSVEPDPVAFDYLVSNTGLNCRDKVTLFNKAVSPNVKMYLDVNKYLGSSMTSVNDYPSGHSIECIGLDELLDIDEYSLIKIDIEGYESILIRDYHQEMIDCGYPFYISFHESFFNRFDISMSEVKECLKGFNYFLDNKGRAISLDDIGGFGSYIIQ